MESNLKSSGCPKVGKPKLKPKLKPKKVEAEVIVEKSGSIEVDDEIQTLKFNDFFQICLSIKFQFNLAKF